MVNWRRLYCLPDRIGAITFKFGRVAVNRFCSAAILLGILSATPVSAWDRGQVDILAVLPDVTPGVPSSVEGLTVGPDDNIGDLHATVGNGAGHSCAKEALEP